MDSIFEKQWFTSREWEVKNHILQFFAPLDPPTAAIVFSSSWWFSQMVGYILPSKTSHAECRCVWIDTIVDSKCHSQLLDQNCEKWKSGAKK